jgi:hypothetical protein
MHTPLARSSWPILGLCLALLWPRAAGAATDLDLSQRIVIDGFATEYTTGEAVFGWNEEVGRPEESANDSQWGPFNDLRQIYVTWDKDSLYVAVEATIFDNNVILLMDITDRSPETTADDGLFAMTELNAWRRNFIFANDFTPDLFLATWDRNTLPQIWTYVGPTEVVQVASTAFRTVATFNQSADGRAMEAAIPWNILFFGESRQVDVPELETTAWSIPEGMDTLRFAAVLTAGPDGTGGPDSAPDNFGGHTINSADMVVIDNYAILPLDTDDIPGIPDFGIEPKERLTFLRRPPIRGIVFRLAEVEIPQAVVSPEEGRPLEFRVRLDPQVGEEEAFRTVSLTARIYDSLGGLVDVLYREDRRPARDPWDPQKDTWDGRDRNGRMVPGGIYVLSVVSEPGLSRVNKGFAVVR